MTLDQWLDIATQRLARPAQIRVCREYRDAYQDAVDAGQTDILAIWGDPHRINHELRKVHLTTRDIRLIHPGYARTFQGWRQAVLEDVGIVGFAWLVTLFRHEPLQAQDFWLLLCVILLATLRWALVVRLNHRIQWRALVQGVLQPLTLMCLFFFWILGRAVVSAESEHELISEFKSILLMGEDGNANPLPGILFLSYVTYRIIRLILSWKAGRKLSRGQLQFSLF